MLSGLYGSKECTFIRRHAFRFLPKTTKYLSLAMAGELSALHFRGLRSILAALPVQGDAAGHNLRLQLDKSRTALRKVLDKPAQNAREKEELEKCQSGALQCHPSFSGHAEY